MTAIFDDISASLLLREYMLHGMGDEVDSFMYAANIAVMAYNTHDDAHSKKLFDAVYEEWVSNTETISSRKPFRENICRIIGERRAIHLLRFAMDNKREALIIYKFFMVYFMAIRDVCNSYAKVTNITQYVSPRYTEFIAGKMVDIELYIGESWRHGRQPDVNRIMSIIYFHSDYYRDIAEKMNMRVDADYVYDKYLSCQYLLPSSNVTDFLHDPKMDSFAMISARMSVGEHDLHTKYNAIMDMTKTLVHAWDDYTEDVMFPTYPIHMDILKTISERPSKVSKYIITAALDRRYDDRILAWLYGLDYSLCFTGAKMYDIVMVMMKNRCSHGDDDHEYIDRMIEALGKHDEDSVIGMNTVFNLSDDVREHCHDDMFLLSKREFMKACVLLCDEHMPIEFVAEYMVASSEHGNVHDDHREAELAHDHIGVFSFLD
jgi:hypothetical protein